MANDGHTEGIYEVHDDGDNDYAEENDPLLTGPDSLSSVEAQGPPPHDKSKLRFLLLLLLPNLVLLLGIGTLCTGVTKYNTSCSIRLDQDEQIANLTTRLYATKSLLDACTCNSTRLAIDLGIERVRFDVCRENREQLAGRLEEVKGELEMCANRNLLLEGELRDAKSREEVCEMENDTLRRRVEGGAFIDFQEFVGSLGTGGDSWVCSDTTQSWSYGYVSVRTPHPTITIKNWTAALSDAEHSASPLVFPPSVIQEPSPLPPSLAYPRDYSEMTHSPEVALPPDFPTHPSSPESTPLLVQRTDVPRCTTPTTTDASIYIVGYSVTSEKTSGHNGWWKISKMDRFGIKDGRIEFWALAGKLYRSKALYEVQVWYIERWGNHCDDLVATR